MSKLRFVLALWLATISATCAAAASNLVYVRCGKLIFDAERPPLTNAAVVIAEGKITAVGAELAAPAGAEQIDLSRYTVLPGLLDAHTHLWSGTSFDTPSTALAAARGTRAVDYALRSGIVAMRVLHTNGFVDVALHDAIEEGTIAGPHIIPAAHALTIPGGHGDFIALPPQFSLSDYYTPLHGFVNSPADAEKAVHLQIMHGAKVIKVMASGGLLAPRDSPETQQLSPEELRVIVEQAHMAHLKVASHAENLASILASLRAGVDSIEHGSGLDEEAIGLMKQNHVVLVPTVYRIAEDLAGKGGRRLGREMQAKAQELAQRHLASFKLAMTSGVNIAAGSDELYEPGGATVRDELVADVQHGMSPQDALVSATRHGAELLGLSALLGTVEVGKEGDLIAVEGDPLTDIQALLSIRAVVYQGKTLSPAGRSERGR
jgi:imidazolonepropionase-like amidohydrolase